jgi:co-chaperonin GroES (HSP10)
MDLQPLGDRLIVEVLDEEETTVSAIVLRGSSQVTQSNAVLAAIAAEAATGAASRVRRKCDAPRSRFSDTRAARS